MADNTIPPGQSGKIQNPQTKQKAEAVDMKSLENPNMLRSLIINLIFFIF